MSAIPKTANLIFSKDYPEGERLSGIHHECVEGYDYATAGASDDHNRIAGNLLGEHCERLRGARCEAFINDMKVEIPSQYGNKGKSALLKLPEIDVEIPLERIYERTATGRV